MGRYDGEDYTEDVYQQRRIDSLNQQLRQAQDSVRELTTECERLRKLAESQQAQPDREAMARALHLSDYPGKPGLWDQENAILQHEYHLRADAILALIASQPTITQVKERTLKPVLDALAWWDLRHEYGPAVRELRKALAESKVA